MWAAKKGMVHCVRLVSQGVQAGGKRGVPPRLGSAKEGISQALLNLNP